MFLDGPDSIRSCLKALAGGADRIDLAFAFIGTDADVLVADLGVPVRVVCWLQPGATDPEAVRRIREHHPVRHARGMHAKVAIAYVADEPVAALVGSANLSKSALGLVGTGGRIEAGVEVREAGAVRDVGRWFDDLWQALRTVDVTDDDLAALPPVGGAETEVFFDALDLEEEARDTLSEVVRFVRRHDLTWMVQQSREVDLLRDLEPTTLSSGDWAFIRGELRRWYPRWLQEGQLDAYDIEDIRAAMTGMFDARRPVVARLKDQEHRPGRIKGLGVPMWSTLLYWHHPERYPPLNGRTLVLLEHLGLRHRLPVNITANAYGRWLRLAGELASELRLPSPGHVDRVVWFWMEGLPGGGGAP